MHYPRDTPAYDPNVCMLDFVDGNYLFVNQRKGACNGESCRWNLQHDPYVDIPAAYDYAYEYICDNQLHPLPWGDTDRNNQPLPNNRYACRCGGGELTTDGQVKENGFCGGRCQLQWQSAFGKRCNVVSQSSRQKGFFTDPLADPSQGACIIAAGQGDFGRIVGGSAAANAYTIIDGVGIATVCNNAPFYSDASNQTTCTCDGELPAELWGRAVTNRDPCGLTKRAANDAWIAGPVVGGVVAVAAIIGLAWWLRRRTPASDIPLQPLPHSSRRNRSASLAPTTNSDVNSADSGVDLLGAPAAPKASAAL